MAKPDFGKMYGPLPLGAWVALIAGGLGVAFYFNKTKGSAGADETSAEEDSVAGGMPGVGTGEVGGWVATAPGSGASTTGPDTAADNDEWGRLAVNRLVGQGYDGATAQSALTKYLYGDPNGRMSTQETAMINLAIRWLGAPPTVPTGSPITVVPGPSPVPPPTQSGKPASPRLSRAPVGLTATGKRKDRVQLNANGIAGATKYVWKMTGRTSQITSAQPIATFTALRPGRTYTFYVRAGNSAGLSPWSSALKVTTPRK